MPTIDSKIGKRISAYKEIENDLRKRVEAGHWAVGATLPARRVLAAEYGVQLGTVQQAISSLVNDGTLTANPRTGTVVAKGILPKNAAVHAHSSDAYSFASRGVRGSFLSRQPEQLHAVVGISAYLPDYIEEIGWREGNWSSIILAAIERYFAKFEGVTLRFENRAVHASREYRTIDEIAAAFQSDKVDAVVHILPEIDIELNAMLRSPFTRECRHVLITEKNLAESVSNVSFDWRNAGYQAGMHLIERGCHDIVFFAPMSAPWADERFAGVEEAAIRSQYAVKLTRLPTTPVRGDLGDLDQRQLACEAASLLFDEGLRPSGVVAVNDHAALGFMDAARSRALTAGEDYAILGFDDIYDARSHGLTSLHPPFDAMASAAGAMIVQMLTGETAPTHVRAPYYIVARASSRFRAAD